MTLAGMAATGSRRIRWQSIGTALAMIIGLASSSVEGQAAVYEDPAPSWGVQGCPPRVRDDCPRVWALAATADRIYVGGQFTQAVWPAGNRTVPRSNLMAIDAVTGQLIEGFAPNPDGVVRSLAVSPDGTRLFVGGDFDTIGGAARPNLAAVDPATGAAQDGWQANASNQVNALTVGNGRLYAGGSFDFLTDATGQRWARNGLAAVNPDTGVVDPDFGASVGGGVTSLTLSGDGSRLFVGGDYMSLNGRGRVNLGAVDAVTGALDGVFVPSGLERVFAIDADRERVYAAQGGGGGRMTAYDQRTGARRWEVTNDGDFQAIAVLSGVVYGGGHFSGKLVAADAVTGRLDPFNPAVNSGGGVWSLLAFGRNLYLGGDFTLVNGDPQRHYAQLPGPPAPPAAPAVAGVVAGNASATLSWAPPADDGGSPVTGYVVTPIRDGVADAPRGTPPGALTLTVTGLRNGSPYRFTVAAENAVGIGEASQTAAVVPLTVPAAPASVTAVPTASGVSVTWVAGPDDGGSPVTGYVVVPHRNGEAGAPRPVQAGAGSLSLSGLDKGVPYRFTVAAENAVGTGPASAPSPEAVFRTVPGAPTGTTGAAGDGSAAVAWDPPADAGGSALTAYLVTPYRDGVASPPRAVAPEATAATITGLANGARYTFTVAAANALGAGPASAPTTGVGPRSGYWMAGADGRVYAFGGVSAYDGKPDARAAGLTVDLEATPSLDGYWTVNAAGVVVAHGDAVHRGDLPAGRLPAGETVTSLSATRGGAGYWLFTSAGRVVAFGDARHFGDMVGRKLNGRVLDSVASPSGQGYYLVAEDGGVFTFGDAAFSGSMGGRRLNAPVESLVPDSDGRGYWLVATDGGVFAFDAPFRGSMGGTRLNQPITGMVRNGAGYLMVAADGGAFNFSDRPFHGSLAAAPPGQPIVAVAAAR